MSIYMLITLLLLVYIYIYIHIGIIQHTLARTANQWDRGVHERMHISKWELRNAPWKRPRSSARCQPSKAPRIT